MENLSSSEFLLEVFLLIISFIIFTVLITNAFAYSTRKNIKTSDFLYKCMLDICVVFSGFVYLIAIYIPKEIIKECILCLKKIINFIKNLKKVKLNDR